MSSPPRNNNPVRTTHPILDTNHHIRASVSPEPSPPRSTPTNDDIEAVIRMATSSLAAHDRPLRDTRTQLFVGNLPYRVRWQDLKDLFRRAGTVLRADVSLGPDNRSRGYGTVLLSTAEDAGRAIDMFNGYCWQTRVLEVRPDRLGATMDADLNINPSLPNPSVPFVQQALNLPVLSALNSFDELVMTLPANGESLTGGTGMRTLFVGNLPFHIQWQDLKDLFRAAGAVTRADVALGSDGRSRGFGTVTFVSEDGAERARRMFEGYEFNGRQLKVHYDKFAQSSQNIPLVGVSPQATSASLLPPYDSLSRLEALHDGRSHSHFDALSQSQLHLDLQRSRLEAEGLSSVQLDALRSSSFKSPSLTPPVALSQSPSHLQLPALLQPQAQSLGANVLGASIAQSILPPSAHSLSQPHSHSGSPLPISAKVSSSSGSSVHSFGAVDSLGSATDLTLVTDLNDIKLSPDSLKSLGTSFGSPRPSLSALSSSQTSSFSSSGSRRPNLSATSSRGDPLNDGASLSFCSQRTSISSSSRPSFGAAGAEKPLFNAGNSQRPSVGPTASQSSNLSTSSQRPAAHPSALLSEDDGKTPSLSAQSTAMMTTKIPLLAPVAMSLSLPAPMSALPAGSACKTASPPSTSGVSGNKWPDLSKIGMPDSKSSQTTSPSHSSSQTPPRNTSEESAPDISLLARSILNADSSVTTDAAWGLPKPQSRKDSPPSKVNGNVDYVSTALGALGVRRANKTQSQQVEEKRKSSGPSGEQQTQASSSAVSQGHGKKSSQSSHRHPGPISLPPPTTFTLPPGIVFSPHAHPQSPVYHPGYPLSPVHPHPMGSPLHHPMGSPLHHPAHVHSPLHHPGHSQYGTYPHHATPVHYGVITPHGLPPITPSMPPFSFLPPQPKTPTQNGQGRENKGNEERSHHASQNDERPTDPTKQELIAQASRPSYYPQFSNAPQQRMPYTPIPPPMFSPGIPLSPGVMVPLSPGVVPQSVPMTMTGVPVPMTPGVALTPGVTMTTSAFWPPWMNPAVGAPVHEPHPGAEGYFPPVSQPSGDMGYFPPVYVPKDGQDIMSGSNESRQENAHGGRERRGSENSSPGVSSPDTSSKGSQDTSRKVGPQVMKRSTSAQCDGGLPKRNGLFHRDSDPEVSTATLKGSKEA